MTKGEIFKTVMQTLATIIGSGGIVALFTVLLGRRKQKVDVADKLNEMSLDLVVDIKKEADDARREAHQARMEMGRLRSEVATLRNEMDDLLFKIRILNRAIFSEAVSRADLQTMASGYFGGVSHDHS